MDCEKEIVMSRFQKVAGRLASYGLDAMMITSEPNRLYAAQFHSTAGAALVTRKKLLLYRQPVHGGRKETDHWR